MLKKKIGFISIFFIISLMLIGCKSIKYVPVVQGETIVIKKDSIIEKIDTAYIQLPYEKENSLALPTETLSMSTKYAVAYAWLDTNFNALRGEIKNKNVKVAVEVKETEKIVYRDSVVTKEIPIEVVKEVTHVPYIFRVTMVGFAILLLWTMRKWIVKLIKMFI